MKQFLLVNLPTYLLVNRHVNLHVNLQVNLYVNMHLRVNFP